MTSWVEIDERRLGGNYRLLREVSGANAGGGPAAAAPELLAVVKANAYGHGATQCAPMLARAGAAWLGVTDAAEGARVRAAMRDEGLARETQPRVLVMCGMLRDDAATIVEECLTPVVWTAEHLDWLAAAAVGQAAPVAVHVEIDTGMSRQGAAAGAELAAVLHAFRAHSGIKLEGVMTHIASSEVARSEQTRLQHLAFEAALEQVTAAGLRPAWVHVGSTSTVDNDDDADADDDAGSVRWVQELAAGVGARAMIRTGIGLHGYCLPIEGGGTARVRDMVRPVMTWKTRVIGIRDVAPGAAVGYNATFVAQRAMRLALLPVGYADGLRRELSSTNTMAGGWVMVRGRRAPIVGRVSMNLTVVDVGDLDEVQVGDVVELLGDGVTADDHARLAGTIAYDILCGVKPSAYLRARDEER